jgi:hypothetical protein
VPYETVPNEIRSRYQRLTTRDWQRAAGTPTSGVQKEWAEKGDVRMYAREAVKRAGQWGVVGDISTPHKPTRKCVKQGWQEVWWPVRQCKRCGRNTKEQGGHQQKKAKPETKKGDHKVDNKHWIQGTSNTKCMTGLGGYDGVRTRLRNYSVYSDGSVKYTREKDTWAWEAYRAG